MPVTSAKVYLLDYGAGNVRSLVNAVKHSSGIDLIPISSEADFATADIVVFPGVGAFGQAIDGLRAKGFPFFGICVGLQSLFASSTESPGVTGLGVIPYTITKFSSDSKVVPHMGWNGTVVANSAHASAADLIDPAASYYFVHSFAAIWDDANADVLNKVTLSATRYGDQVFVAAFHPEKSGLAGLQLIRKYLSTATAVAPLPATSTSFLASLPSTSSSSSSTSVTAISDKLTKRIIACLDIRANDAGALVVTKGHGYDVRENPTTAHEIAFLNITSFRSVPVADLPMLDLLRRASQSIFVPLTIGGGIRDIVEPSGRVVSALDVVAEYFRAGADKVSIGSDAVYAAEQVWAGKVNGQWPAKAGKTAIEQIARVYGAQAVVVSVDPRRVYVADPSLTTHHTIRTAKAGPNGEQYCWYECTVKGGREARDLDVVQLVTACEYLGAGEVLLNCMDTDGSKSGFDLELTAMVKQAVKIPVVASSGAGHVKHFEEVFEATNADAALAAGIFHRKEVPLPSVKTYLSEVGVPTRLV
ncbi:imidazole glycerol phosphate synthase [Catenaria anguillulae PL171]|uniref:Imidazole glycerol phosphate synthase n=1 Tax=Catenaria anguillulae PL171 TaxID=765915 RepID=A0A1Y2HGN1_9FUNG|nr:imidazole glycerol phosphate synthase [Catenaria anguillulae PL171]